MQSLTVPSGYRGEFFTDETIRTLYATDASAYQETPRAVAIPRDAEDVGRLVAMAHRDGLGLIPRTAGTSLAGQVVGHGVVVDVSRHLTRILAIDPEARTVTVEPGVIRNELNMALAPHGLFFGPETSTQNRAMMGGMLGNNSCGSNSLAYGTTRDKVLSVSGYLANGEQATFSEMTREQLDAACDAPDDTLERTIHRGLRAMLDDAENRQAIRDGFPHPEIKRRNTGYALDFLANSEAFTPGSGLPYNPCQLIAGSEGTLFFATRITLRCDPTPPPAGALLCAHFHSLEESLHANLIGLRHHPHASELIDHYILECTSRNIAQRQNRFFVQGEPGAILVIELRGDGMDAVRAEMNTLIDELRAEKLGYHYPVLEGPDMNRIWDLRKAGLGLLSNMPGDAKPVPVIEDAAVRPADLPAYVKEVHDVVTGELGLPLVHYAHAGSGELHIRPIVNLKTAEGNRLFRETARRIADLVIKYRGSLSGEHGDGRLRGEFIPLIVGDRNFQLFREVKALWDPNGVFNPGKIVDTPPMNENLRYRPGQGTREIKTWFRFDETGGFLRAAEMCNGSGDCRKTHLTGGTMCPSYMATRDEKDTTRARANILRHVITNSEKLNPFDSGAIKEVLDLCLSCKGCKNECPSNVDMAKLKAEFLQHYHDANGIPLRSLLIAHYRLHTRLAAPFAPVYNFLFAHPVTGPLMKRMTGFAPARSMPALPLRPLRAVAPALLNGSSAAADPSTPGRRVHFFCDEFTDYPDRAHGEKALLLLRRLGYEVSLPDHIESGRSSLSKGLLKRAKRIAEENVRRLAPVVTEETPLVGFEPSAILCFRDEYPDLVGDELLEDARHLAANSLLFEEFIMREWRAGRIDPTLFTDEARTVHLHGHCQQKAVASLEPSREMLSIPRNYTVRVIPSGCCGMAGSFGYEAEHYDLSMRIGELVLFPAVREAGAADLIAAPGTSCRHQIKDGTGRIAQHPAEVLYDALRDT